LWRVVVRWQGYINLAQAEAVFCDVVRYLRCVNGGVGGAAAAAPLSLGVVTLNRPQRALLHAFVHAARHRLGLVPLSQANAAATGHGASGGPPATPGARAAAAAGAAGSGGGGSSSSLNGFVRHPRLRHPGDQVLFIQSIDQIQGEERDVILFSTLLAPRTAAKEVVAVASEVRGGGRNGDSDEGEGSEEGEGEADLLDKLEELEAASEEDASDEDDDEEAGEESAEEEEATSVLAARPSHGAQGSATGGRRRAALTSDAKKKKTRRPRSRSRSPQQPAGGTRALGLSYSTLAHAHGERLLNVGLTRAVKRKKANLSVWGRISVKLQSTPVSALLVDSGP
jgi:hypothetical protein